MKDSQYNIYVLGFILMYIIMFFIVEPSLLGAPFRRDSTFPESDPDMKRRFPMMNHNQDVRYRGSGEPPLLSRLPAPLPAPPIQSPGGWLVEEDNSRTHFNSRASGIVQGTDALRPDKQRARQNPFSHVSEVKNEEVCFYCFLLLKFTSGCQLGPLESYIWVLPQH